MQKKHVKVAVESADWSTGQLPHNSGYLRIECSDLMRRAVCKAGWLPGHACSVSPCVSLGSTLDVSVPWAVCYFLFTA